mgnify:CR=1 FL=1
MSFRNIESINESDEVKKKEVSTKKSQDVIDNQSLKSKEKIIELEKKFNNEVEESYNTIKKNIDKLSGEKGEIVKKECSIDSKNKELTAAICYEKASYDRIKSIYKDYSEFKKDPNKLLDVIKMREFASNMRERFENCINPNNNLSSEKKNVNDIYKNTYEMWDKLCDKIEVNIEKKEKNTGTEKLDNYYQIDFTIDSIRDYYDFDVSCQGSVPQALQAFFESESYEDAIRNAISIGGDSDTIAAITGAVAGAYYGIPDDIKEKASSYLNYHLQTIVNNIDNKIRDKF